jgi:hypothetical protein
VILKLEVADDDRLGIITSPTSTESDILRGIYDCKECSLQLLSFKANYQAMKNSAQ